MAIPIIGAGGPRDRASIPLAARSGWQIPNERRAEITPEQRRAAVEMHKDRSTARLRSMTAVYNCMGMVFATRRTWIDTQYLERILVEDGYSRLSGVGEAITGDVVVYRRKSEVSHVGLIIAVEPRIADGSREILVLSKWGAVGEYIHPVNDVPVLLGDPVEYWSERRLP